MVCISVTPKRYCNIMHTSFSKATVHPTTYQAQYVNVNISSLFKHVTNAMVDQAGTNATPPQLSPGGAMYLAYYGIL